MNVNFNGYNENVATFVVDETVSAGALVKITDNYTVAACEANDEIVGVCLNVRDGYGAIQLSGYIEAKTTSNIGVGYKNIVANGSDTVTTADTGKAYLVIMSEDDKIGFIL